MQLRPYQHEAVQAVYRYLREHDDNPCVVLPTGCHAKGHPILMHDGTVKPVQDVRVGERVMGDDSTPRTVLTLCRGRETMYRITPHRGKPFVVNASHVLSLISTPEGKRFPSSRRGGGITNIVLREYLARPAAWRERHHLYRVFPHRPNRDVLYTGFTVERMPEDDFFGFTLDGNRLYVDGNFVVHHNSGKTPVMATICRDAVIRWNGRVLILAHVKELLEQAADKLRMICPEVSFGVYSAGLKRRDTDHKVIIAGIQSVYKRACEIDAVDLVIVDEAHLIQPSGEGMYRQFLADMRVINPHVRTIGLTATPFRMKSGLICGPENILNAVCYEIGVKELIRDGYLCPLITKAGLQKPDTSGLHLRAGEFIADEVEQLMDRDELVHSACREIVQYTADRQACLIFAASVKHARHVQSVLQEQHGVECGVVTGGTPAGERAELLARFRRESADTLFGAEDRRPLKYLVNVNVLTTGFDAPNVDCVALLRPTNSPGLYYQCVGRAFRLSPGKTDALILDFGGNVLRHGPVDQLRVADSRDSDSRNSAPAKECPECRALIAAGYASCPQCGYTFPDRRKTNHEATAGCEGVLSGQVSEETYDVLDVQYFVHRKRGADADAPRSMRVQYRIGWHRFVSEWVCIEHPRGSFPRHKAESWWLARSHDPVPDSSEEAVTLAEAGALAIPQRITVRTVAGDPFERVVDVLLGPKPESVPLEQRMGLAEEDIPF